MRTSDKVNVKELKSNGFLQQVQKDRFSLRLRVAGGQLKAEHLLVVEEVARTFGKGYVHMTSRQSIEIPFIQASDIPAAKKILAEGGLEPAAGGSRVRTITACQGSAICQSGLIDTSALADQCNDKYYGQDLPHKFKIGITGCRNNCLKAEENDLGIKGAMRPRWDEQNCTYCGICATICPADAIEVVKDKKAFAYKEELCIYCGRCVKKCPTDAWVGESGYILYFGGLFGNRIQIGQQLLPVVYSEEELHRTIEKTLAFFEKHGQKGERFGNTLQRVGFDLLKKELL